MITTVDVFNQTVIVSIPFRGKQTNVRVQLRKKPDWVGFWAHWVGFWIWLVGIFSPLLKRNFLYNYTTTIKGVAYVAVGKNTISIKTLRHEAIHVLQSEVEGWYKHSLKYFFSKKWKYLYEKEAYGLGIIETTDDNSYKKEIIRVAEALTKEGGYMLGKDYKDVYHDLLESFPRP